jgi:hypothetical protein
MSDTLAKAGVPELPSREEVEGGLGKASCAFCSKNGSVAEMLVCDHCRGIAYCNELCGNEHWHLSHHAECHSMKKMKKKK